MTDWWGHEADHVGIAARPCSSTKNWQFKEVSDGAEEGLSHQCMIAPAIMPTDAALAAFLPFSTELHQ